MNPRSAGATRRVRLHFPDGPLVPIGLDAGGWTPAHHLGLTVIAPGGMTDWWLR